MVRFFTHFSPFLVVLFFGFIHSNLIKELGEIFTEKKTCDGSSIDVNAIKCTNQNERYPTIDGSCNNCVDPRVGKAFIPLKRLLAANYVSRHKGSPRTSRKVLKIYSKFLL